MIIATLKFTWLLAAVALAGWLITRRHKQARWFQIVELVAITGFVLIGVGAVHLPNFEKVLEDAGQSLGAWTYLVVGFLAFAETGAFIGFIAPGETAVIVGGLVAGQGQISLLALIAIVWACAVLGDVTSYELGRRLGRQWLLKHGERLKITEERLDQVQHFFDRRGGTTIIVGRFLGFVRPIMPFTAGASKMPFRRFLPYDVLAAGAWSTTFCVLGFLFWRSIDRLTTYVSRGLFAFGTLVVVIAAIVALIRLRRDAESRAKVRAFIDEREDKRGWRLVAKVARPAWHFVLRPAAAIADMTARFSAERLTPGNLGLELTTLLALLAVSTFSFFLLGDVIEQPGEPRIDRWAEDVANRLNTDVLVSIAKMVTQLGSLAAAAIAVVLTAGWALTRRRFIDVGTLVLGLGLSYAAVHVTKNAYDRPRPANPLVATDLSSFPSGHACYAVTLVACATVLVRGGVGWAARVAAVTIAVVIVAVVTISRVYLRAHFLTDALGGAALGVAVWSLVGVLALFAGRVRHNDAVA
jgi:undecaprenyl-diphosphatase